MSSINKSSYFMVRRGQRLGDRLILRFPQLHFEVQQALRGQNNIPNSITVGYYGQLEEPDGAWYFMPVHTVFAHAALGTRFVQERIARDLQIRMADKPLGIGKEPEV